jgi:thiol-disulfide isomerase/thioredoxin
MGLFFYSNVIMKKHFKAFLLVALSALVLVFSAYYFFGSTKNERKTEIEIVDKMQDQGVPKVSDQTIDGREYDFSKRNRKITIINFWASWCAPCVEEIPSLVQLARHFKDEIDIVAISSDEDLKDIHIFLKSFPELNDENIFIIQDQKLTYKNLFSVERLPESFIVKSNGLLEKKVIGTITWYNSEAIAYIDNLIKKQN